MAAFGPHPSSAAMRFQHTGTTPADWKPGQRKRALVSGRGERSSREGLRESLRTERARQVGTKPHSLGGPAAAKITDKLTYKESFYFMSKPQRLTVEPPADERHRGAKAAPVAPTRSPGTSVSLRSASLKRQGKREGGKGRFRTQARGRKLDMQKSGRYPKPLDHRHHQGLAGDLWQGHPADRTRPARPRPAARSSMGFLPLQQPCLQAALVSWVCDPWWVVQGPELRRALNLVSNPDVAILEVLIF